MLAGHSWSAARLCIQSGGCVLHRALRRCFHHSGRQWVIHIRNKTWASAVSRKCFTCGLPLPQGWLSPCQDTWFSTDIATIFHSAAAALRKGSQPAAHFFWCLDRSVQLHDSLQTSPDWVWFCQEPSGSKLHGGPWRKWPLRWLLWSYCITCQLGYYQACPSGVQWIALVHDQFLYFKSVG